MLKREICRLKKLTKVSLVWLATTISCVLRMPKGGKEGSDVKKLRKQLKKQFLEERSLVSNGLPKLTKKKKRASGPMKTVEQILAKGPFHEYLLNQDPYYRTLLDPFNVRGVRIPDMTVTPSAPFSLTKRFSVAAQSNGCVGACIGITGDMSSAVWLGSMVPQRVITVTTSGVKTGGAAPGTVTNSPANGSVGHIVGINNESKASIFSNFSSFTEIVFQNWNYDGTQGTCPVRSYFTNVRVVSAGLNCQFLGNYTNSNGRIVAASVARQTVRDQNDLTVSTDQLATLPGSKIIPINQMGGATVYYRPTDARSLSYASLDPALDITGMSLYNINNWFANRAEALGGEMYLVCDGLSTGVEIQFTLTINYEGTPRTNELNLVAASPSPCDVVALGKVMSRVQQMPTVVAAAADNKGATPQTSAEMSLHPPVEQSKGWFDQLTDGIEKAVGTIGKIAPVVGPMLAAL